MALPNNIRASQPWRLKEDSDDSICIFLSQWRCLFSEDDGAFLGFWRSCMGYVQEAGVCLFLGGLAQPRGAQRQGWWLGAPMAASSWSSGSLGVSQSKTSPHCRSGFCPVLFWPLLEPEHRLGQKRGQEEPNRRKGPRRRLSAASPEPGHRVWVQVGAAAPCLPSSLCHPLTSFQPHWGRAASPAVPGAAFAVAPRARHPLPQHRLS